MNILGMQSVRQVVLLILIAVTGINISYKVSTSIQEQTAESWVEAGENDARELTQVFTSWFDEVYIPIRSMAVLLTNTTTITADGFQRAADQLEAFQTRYFPETLMYVVASNDSEWVIEKVTENDLGLQVGQSLSHLSAASDSVNSAIKWRGEMMLSPTDQFVPGGKYYAFAALSVNGQTEGVVVGVMDVDEIDKQMKEVVPYGMGFGISSRHASGVKTEARDHLYPKGESSADAIAKFDIPVTSGNTEFIFHWGVTDSFRNGSESMLARAVFIIGIVISVLIALALGILLARNSNSQRIAREQKELYQNSEQRLIEVTNNMPGAVYQTLEQSNGEARFTFASKRVKELFGFDEKESVTDFKTTFSHILKDDIPRISESLSIARNNLTPWFEEYRVQLPDKPMKWIENGAVPQQMDDGSIIWNGYWRDITEQKSLQDKIAESEYRYQLALESANVGIWDADLTTGKAHYNEQYFKMLGYERDNFEDNHENWIQLIHPEDRERSRINADKLTTGKVDRSENEFRMLASNGEEKSILSIGTITNRDENNKPTRIIGIHIDITERKLMEKEIRKAKEAAEQAAQAKASFLATMSHEIRTPMNGIIGMVDLLNQSDLSKNNRHMLQTISNSGQTLLTLINDILDISKIEAGKLQLESAPFSFLDTLDNSVDMIKSAALKKKLKLVTYVDPTIPQFVSGDSVRIRQILINLTGNAIKFTERGEIVIRADRIESDEKKLKIRIRVIDNGIGISEEAQKNLFKEFSQADTSTTRKYGGTGLGLSICQSLTEMMGGQIKVESELGKGTEFIVDIPLMLSDKKIDEEPNSDFAGLKVVLVIANEMEKFVCQKYLEFWDVNLEYIDDINSCLETVRANVEKGNIPDIIVLGSDWTREKKISLRTTFMQTKELADIRFVILMEGHRTKVRLDDAEVVTLDVGPLKRVAFLSAVSIAAGRASPEVFYENEVEDMKSKIELLTPEQALEKGELILVAEDNLVNQDVITRQLNMLGYTCEIADNGQLALDAWLSKDYAILLTDCHMPEMDGYELTEAIRQDEKRSGKRKPIIAISANALQGEAARCVEAGMDDYMSKPIELKVLRDKLRKWMPRKQAANDEDSKDEIVIDEKSEEVPSATEKDNNVIDGQVLRDLLGNDDDETFKNIISAFIEPSQNIVVEIKQGWKERSAESVKQAAHKLKSSARSVGANALADLCQSLEQAGKDDDWSTIDDNIANIDKLMDDVENYISNL